MDIHRYRNNMALIGHVLDQQGGQIASQLPFLASSSSEASTPCSASWRTATPMFHCMAVGGLPPAMRFSAAACSACGTDGRIVDPGAAALVVFLREHGDCPRFATAGPPVHDIRVLRGGLARAKQRARQRSCHGHSLQHWFLPRRKSRILPVTFSTPPSGSRCQAQFMTPAACRPRSFRPSSWSGKLVFAQGTTGKIEASTTRNPCTPRTRPA